MAAAPTAPRSDLDLKKFRKKLEAERERVTTELKRVDDREESGGEAGENSEIANYDQHPADQGTELFLREQDSAIASGMKGELDQIESALRKVEDGTYGYCARCSQEIPKERLDVMPSALYCIQCASDVSF